MSSALYNLEVNGLALTKQREGVWLFIYIVIMKNVLMHRVYKV